MISTYFFVTSLMLLYNTIRDLKTYEIDERFNYLAIGSTLMLIAFLKPPIWYIYALVLTSFVLIVILKRYYTTGDLQALAWIFLGLGAINYFKIIKFLISFTFLLSAAFLISKLIRHKAPIPGYPCLFGAYLITIFW